MSPHPLTNFEIQKYYQNKPKFNCVYSRNNFAKIKDGTYLINLDDFKSIGTHWLALYVKGNNIIYFDSFGIEHISKVIKRFIENKNIITNICKMQSCDSISCEYFWIGFIHLMLNGKSLIDYTYLFFLKDYEKNDEIILRYFQ